MMVGTRDGDGDRLRHLKLALTRLSSEHDRACGPSPKYPACLPASLPSRFYCASWQEYEISGALFHPLRREVLSAPSHARRTA